MIAAPTKISNDVLDVLRQAECDGPHLRIHLQLDRKLYVATNKALEALGGKWNRREKAHVFPEEAAPLISDVVSCGEYVDPQKAFQFFPTPHELAELVCDRAAICEGDLVLEPCAGNGAIALAARSCGGVVTCFEIQEKLVSELKANGFDVAQADFLELLPEKFFDVVVMNPPFARSQDIAHVRHAYEYLKPGGNLVAIMSPGFTFRSDSKAVSFRDWLDDVGGTWEPLPDNSFRSSGTNVQTVLVTI